MLRRSAGDESWGEGTGPSILERGRAEMGQFLRCMEVLGQEEEARSDGTESRQRSFKGQLREDDQAEEEARCHPLREGWQEEENPPEIESREYADGDSREADLAALNEGDNLIAPHREIQEEQDPSGKEGASTKKRRRRLQGS